MPALEAQLDALRKNHTQVLSISIDSSPVHANFGASLGGISYPMLADFHPKGAAASSLGLYNEDYGITQRATVIVDASGVVQHASISKKRDMAELVELCSAIDAKHSLSDLAPKADLPSDLTVYVRNNCAASRAVLLARTNLHLDGIVVKNVSDNPDFLVELKAHSGGETAPVLIANKEVIADSAKIVSYLVDKHG